MSEDFDYLRTHIVGAIESTSGAVTAISRLQDSHSAEIERLWADNAALRDELHALSNRVENLTRAVTADPSDVAAKMLSDGFERGLRALEDEPRG